MDGEQRNLVQSFADRGRYESLQRLLTTIVGLEQPPYYATAGDLDWWYGRIDELDFLSRVAVWRDADTTVGFVWPSEGWPTAHFVDVFAHPAYPGLLDKLLAFGEDTCRARGGDALGAWAFDSDTERKNVFAKRGYQLVQDMGPSRICPIDREPVVPTLPPGYSVGALEDGDLPSRVRAQQSAFDSKLNMTQYDRVRRMPTYRADLDIVAKAPSGEIASFCIVWLDVRNNFAVFEPVGTHKAHQRLGLGKAVLLEGLHRLWRLGVRRANVIGGPESNPASRQLYQSAGFGEIDRLYTFEKQLT